MIAATHGDDRRHSRRRSLRLVATIDLSQSAPLLTTFSRKA
jgi:hypothetical protein